MNSKKYSIVKSKDNYDILEINCNNKKIYSTSIYNTKREVDKLINYVKENLNKSNIIIFGLSNGEYLEDLMKYDIKSKIYIIDFIDDILEDKVVNLREKNIEIIKIDDIENMNFKMDGISCLIYFYGNYKKILSEKIETILENIYLALGENAIKDNTIKYFSDIWIKNMFENLKFLSESQKIDDYKGVYEGKSAIIVSAGPSLEQSLRLLKGNEEKFIIISGGRTLPTLKRHGIDVDFTCIIDGGEESYDVVKEGLDYETRLVFNELIIPKILEEFNGEKIFFPSLNNRELLSYFLGYKGEALYQGGSVAHTCTDFAVYLGCKEVIFIGQDLAFTDNKYHADISSIADNPKDNVVSHYGLLVEDVYGNKVGTSFTLNSFRMNLEQYIADAKIINNDIEFINSSSGGANIEGAKFCEFIEVINKTSLGNGKKNNLKRDTLNIDKLDLEQKIENISQGLKDLEKECDKIVLLYQKLKVCKNNKNFNIILNEIDLVEGKVKDKSNSNLFKVIWPLLYNVSVNIVRDNSFYSENSNKLEISCENGIKLYGEISKKVKYFKAILK